jgi:hypothetical protein
VHDDPAEAVEDRRPDPDHRAQGVAVVLRAYPYASDFAQILANVRRYPAWELNSLNPNAERAC